MSDSNLYVNEKLTTEKNEQFKCAILNMDNSSGSVDINSIDWRDPEYSRKVLELGLVSYVDTNTDTFVKVMAEGLNVGKYNIEGLPIKTETIADYYSPTVTNTYKPSYVYDMSYVDFSNNREYMNENNLNHLGNLFSVNGDVIYSNAIIFKNRIESQSDSMIMETITKEDIQNILYNKVYTLIVTWDEEWKERREVGDLHNFANDFFDNEKIYKVELAFLKYNINIWYTMIDGGSMTLLGKLLKRPIEKCIIFTMNTHDCRGSISLDEVNKIIELSKVLPDFNVPPQYNEDIKDSIGRIVVWNKYKLLDRLFYSKCCYLK
jgi:hypothetical protein